jgi:tRNA(fMet)-specific endonuclease VapC
METVLIDTSILIGRFRNEPSAFKASERVAGYQMVICDVVLAEILAGSRNHAEYLKHHREFTENFHILPFTMEVSIKFREILLKVAPQHEMHLADHLIAATALAHDVPLLTLNQKHFSKIKGLQLA